MANVTFFVEGKADRKFIVDFVEDRFALPLDIKADFIELGSWSGYKRERNRFVESTALGKKNILILDNDTLDRRSEVESDIISMDVSCHLFLLPDNSTLGELEDLLSDIAVKRDIIACFDQYKQCIKGYKPVDQKDKIYAYLDALLSKQDKSKFIRDENRNYRIRDHWDLNHDSLTNLYTFLNKFLR